MPNTKPRLKKILVATTLGQSSDHVVAAGSEVARLTGAELHLLHAYVMPAIYYGSPMGMTAVQPYDLEGEQKQIEKLLEAQLERLEIPAEEVAGQILEVGTAHRLLVESAEELGVDLILIGTSESQGPLAPLLGSTADRVLRKSRLPVWVVRQGARLPPEGVLTTLDLSDLSEESALQGLRLVEAVSGGHPPKVETLFVLSQVERAGSVQFSPEQVERFAYEELQRRVQELGEKSGFRPQPVLRVGLPRQEIMAQLEKDPADLVVLGTHGRSGFERLLMGSVAADVVRHAPSSVLVVPPAEAREKVAEEAQAEVRAPVGVREATAH